MTQEAFPRSQNCSPATKVTTKWLPGHTTAQNLPNKHIKHNPKSALSALVGDPTAVTLTTNHFNFIEWSWLRFLGSKKMSPEHKVAPRPRKWSKFTKHINISQKATLSALTGDSMAVISAINHMMLINIHPVDGTVEKGQKNLKELLLGGRLRACIKNTLQSKSNQAPSNWWMDCTSANSKNYYLSAYSYEVIPLRHWFLLPLNKRQWSFASSRKSYAGNLDKTLFNCFELGTYVALTRIHDLFR